MLINNCFNLDASTFVQRNLNPDRDPYAYVDALNLFDRVRSKVKIQKIWNWISGRRTKCLMDLDEVKAQIKVTNSHYCGIREVPLSQIRGSQGRVCDFDAQFQPLDNRSKERWLSVATALFQGMGLSAVDLVKIGDYYFVLDGNHRVSVARAMGKYEIDATVIEWQVMGTLPWEPSPYSIVSGAAVAM